MSLTRENFVWHKLHSLTGIIPVGFYMVQHLVLNSFSFAGPGHFNAVIRFFSELMPKHVLLALEFGVIAIPLLFHGVYGVFITQRAKLNVYQAKYRHRENLMFALQRYTGVALILLLAAHVWSTTVNAKMHGDDVILYAAWQAMLTSNGYIGLIVYMLGVLLASYHLSYGLWNFAIRWGITISDSSQIAMRKVSSVVFVVVTALGWLALFGFLMHSPVTTAPVEVRTASVHAALR